MIIKEDQIISCKEATRLISESSERKLSLKERLALAVHLKVCNLCRRFLKQLTYLREISSLFLSAIVKNASSSLPLEAKQRIKKSLINK